MLAGPYLLPYQNVQSGHGNIGVMEASKHIGFDVKRVYFLHDIDEGAVRGHHAHKMLRQFMFCVSGSVTINFEGENGDFTFDLSAKPEGIVVPPGYWRKLSNFEPGTIVIVLASEEYDPADYIRDYDEFQAWLAARREPAEVPYLPLNRQNDDIAFDLERAITSVMRHGPLIGGPKVTRFEEEFAEFCGVSHVVGCSNGLDALVVALEALGVGAGDEVVVPANSFVASALAVSLTGAKPVFADVDPKTYGVTAETVEAAVTPRTRVVMPVHLYGIPVDMDGIASVAAAHGLKVIEDVAQAHGAKFRDRVCGSFGDIAGFSFYPTKILGALGDAGAMATNDTELAERARLICNYGSRKKYYHAMVGRNTRLDPLQAAALSVKLPRLGAWSARRADLAARYVERLADVDWLRLPEVPQDRTPIWHVFPARVVGRSRDELVQHLSVRAVQTNMHYPLPIHLQTAYADLGHKEGDFPVTEAASRELVSLPLDPYHTDAEIDRVIDLLRAY